MIIIGLFLNVAALGLLCWALYSLAIYALPAFLGVSAFFAIGATGQGEFIAILGGLLAGGAAWGAGRTAFALIRSTPLRLLIGVAFATPAAIAGYHLFHGFSAIGSSSDGLRQIVGLFGAVAIGATALARLASDPAAAMQASRGGSHRSLVRGIRLGLPIVPSLGLQRSCPIPLEGACPVSGPVSMDQMVSKQPAAAHPSFSAELRVLGGSACGSPEMRRFHLNLGDV